MHRTTEELTAQLAACSTAPSDQGTVELIVRRPAIGARELLGEGVLDPVVGLVGDTWDARPSRHTPDGSPHPGMQLTLMNARFTAVIAGPDRQRWALAGDQLYVDFDLSEDAVPAGCRLAVGSAVVEVTDQPHTGCAKFTERFGLDAMRFVNSADGRRLRLRGVNTRVLEAGAVRRGDPVRRLP